LGIAVAGKGENQSLKERDINDQRPKNQGSLRRPNGYELSGRGSGHLLLRAHPHLTSWPANRADPPVRCSEWLARFGGEINAKAEWDSSRMAIDLQD
jgi:hypothetical protein